jgi:hypothetical protein
MGRRQILRAGCAGLLGVGLPHGRSHGSAVASEIQPWPVRAKSVIFLFQWGGPSQLDMFDLKPNAPDTVRSPYSAIRSSADGIQVSDQLPEIAKRMHHVTLIRSMTHTMKNHASAGYYAITGHAPPRDDQRLQDTLDLWPAYGSVVDRYAPSPAGTPSFVAYPHRIHDGSIVPGQHASFLGKRHDPLFFTNDPAAADFRLPELNLPQGVDLNRMGQRRRLLKIIDQQRGMLEDRQAAGVDAYYEAALAMIANPRVREAFDLTLESDSVRDRYGRTTYGQSCLLARRLVEAGVRFVTVYFDQSIGGQSTTSGGWDTHGFNNTKMYEIVNKWHLPLTEQTLPTLLDELDERGLLDETLVVWMGEFGRTPKINGNASRDHWPQCYTVLLAGGGAKRGFVYGASDPYGMYPAEKPVRPEDLAATIYALMGIDPAMEVYDVNQRPLPLAGDPIHAVMA